MGSHRDKGIRVLRGCPATVHARSPEAPSSVCASSEAANSGTYARMAATSSGVRLPLAGGSSPLIELPCRAIREFCKWQVHMAFASSYQRQHVLQSGVQAKR